MTFTVITPFKQNATSYYRHFNAINFNKSQQEAKPDFKLKNLNRFM